MRKRRIARVGAVLTGPSLVLLLGASACEPQDIYLFDAPPAQTRVDAGTNQPVAVSPRPTPPRDAEPDPADRDAAPPEQPEQPECVSAACDACVEQASCSVPGALFFCHPETARCSLACDPGAPASQPGCLPAERCDPRLGLCVECVANSGCGGVVPICDTRRGSCVGCVAEADCATAARPRCDLSTSSCVQCRNDADCSGEDARCLPGEQRCVECVVNAHCSDPTRPICSSEHECDDD
jgi:hypothetical protein